MFLTVCASLWAWWKNNSFTQAAIEADEQLHKKGQVDMFRLLFVAITIILGILVAGVIALAKGFFDFNNMMEG